MRRTGWRKRSGLGCRRARKTRSAAGRAKSNVKSPQAPKSEPEVRRLGSVARVGVIIVPVASFASTESPTVGAATNRTGSSTKGRSVKGLGIRYQICTNWCLEPKYPFAFSPAAARIPTGLSNVWRKTVRMCQSRPQASLALGRERMIRKNYGHKV